MAKKFNYSKAVYDKKTDFPTTGDVDTIYIDASQNKAYRYDVNYFDIGSAEVDIWGAMGSLSKGGGGGGGASWGSINGTLSNQTDLNTALSAKQNTLTLTTTGTSGAATLSGATLNIPQYSGGGGGGIHGAMIRSGVATTYIVNSLSSYSATSTSNLRLSAVPFIPIKTFTTASFYINVGTSQVAAIARILIYSELNGLPNQKLYESANLDLSSSGIKTATTSFTFTAGTTYFICTHTQGTAGVTHIPATSLMPISIGGISTPTTFFSSTVSWPIGSAPTTFGSVNSLNGAAILVGITSA
jgi:hypothetical protein